MTGGKSILSICLMTLLTLLSTYIQAQEDSLHTTKDWIRSNRMTDPLFKEPGKTVINPTLPMVPPAQIVLPVSPVTLPNLPLIPYYTNPSPLFKGDYYTHGILLPHKHGILSVSSSQSSIPGIGRFNEASMIYAHALNDRLNFQLSVNAMKINMSHLSGQAFSTSGMMYYQATDKLGFRVFGTYAPGNTYGITTNIYGGTLRWQISDRFGLEMGAQRYYDSMRGGWQTVPVVIPSYRFDKFKLELDVGGIIYEILRSTLFDNAHDSRGPTIAPPKFSYPVK